MYTLFVTGGIGSGKSAFVRRLGELGASVYDLDAVSHEVLQERETVWELVGAFGPEILEGADGLDLDLLEPGACSDPCALPAPRISRPALAWRAFSSPEATERLNGIVHPRVFRRLAEELGAGCACCAPSGGVVNVVEVQLIDKAGDSIHLADEVLGILCPREARRRNAQARGMSGEDFDRRDALQITDEERAALCTATLANDGTFDDLMRLADQWWDAHRPAHA